LSEERDYAIEFAYKPEWMIKAFILIATAILGIVSLFYYIQKKDKSYEFKSLKKVASSGNGFKSLKTRK
jgi:hypothetical protein